MKIPITTNMITIANFHIRIKTNVVGESDFILSRIKQILHKNNIHSSTIQPEWDGEKCVEPQCNSGCDQYQCCMSEDINSKLP